MSTLGVMIVGFGNPLMGDDGVGPDVVRRLSTRRLPPWVEVVDGGSDALVLPTLWHGQPAVWAIDALARGARPGTIHRMGHDRLLAIDQTHATAHRLSLPESLRWIALACPELADVRYRLWGVEPGRIEPRTSLGIEVEQAARNVAREIAAKIREGAAAPVGIRPRSC